MTQHSATHGFRKETHLYFGQHLELDLWRPNDAPKGLVVHAHGEGSSTVHGMIGLQDTLAQSCLRTGLPLPVCHTAKAGQPAGRLRKRRFRQ